MSKDAKKNKKKGMSTKERDAMSRALIIAIIVFVLSLVLVFIPESAINEIGKTKAQKQYEDNLQGKVGANEQIEVIDVVEDKAKYNTIYNGEDYDKAVAEYWTKYPDIDNASIYTYLNNVDLNEIYAPLVHGEVDTTLTVTLSETDTFNKQMLTDFEKIYFDKTLECIGVVRDYFAIMRYPETNSIFVLDCRDKYFSHSESLLQIGLRVSGSLDTQYVTCTQDNGFDYYFVGVTDTKLDKVTGAVEEVSISFAPANFVSDTKCIRVEDCNINVGSKSPYAVYTAYSDGDIVSFLQRLSEKDACSLSMVTCVAKVSDCYLFRLSRDVFIYYTGAATFELNTQYSIVVPRTNISIKQQGNYDILYCKVV